MSYFFGLKNRVLPRFLLSNLPSDSSFNSLSRVYLSSSCNSSAISAAGNHGFTDLTLIANMNSLSVGLFAMIHIVFSWYLCFMLLAAYYVKFIYDSLYRTYIVNVREMER